MQPDKDGCDQDAGEEVGGFAVVAHGHTTPLLQACEAPLDAVAQVVFGPVAGAWLLATTRRDDRLSPLGLDCFDQGASVVAIVSQHVARCEPLEQCLGLGDVVALPTCEQHAYRSPQGVDGQMDLRAQTSSGAP